jgi:uncharacterized membrane protein YphA (DoxX/SURF4 family)
VGNGSEPEGWPKRWPVLLLLTLLAEVGFWTLVLLLFFREPSEVVLAVLLLVLLAAYTVHTAWRHSDRKRGADPDAYGGGNG